MYLKRLELLGFKSFPEKTVVKLPNGVTSIVGPNGCGKSNILDAMRWVLGEQKVSLLRGTKMEEVIFNGTKDLKPLGMAEVTLVIQNAKGKLPTDYSEVQITRRLFRSGESEYLLNKVPCRLKDIIDMLMDTGVGAHVYSMIQQDMVDAILSDRTDDRRFLFEEAAGISKYKNRKKAALRKLSATEQDLIRLRDIVAEVNTQVNSLRRQVKKAERYQAVSDEVKAWELYLGKHAADELKTERRELQQQKEKLNDDKLGQETNIDSLSAELEEERRKVGDFDGQITELAGKIYDKSEVAHSLETEISVLREKKDNARNIKGKNSQEIDALGKRKEILQEQIEQTTSDLEAAEKDMAGMESEVEEIRRQSETADEKVLTARREKETINRQIVTVESELSAGKSDDTNLKELENDLTARLGELDLQLQNLESRAAETRKHLAEMESTHHQAREKENELKSRQLSLESEIADINGQIEELSGQIFDLNASLEGAEARRRLLAEMVAHYEGFGAGVIAAFNNRENWPDLLGTVADRITPHDGYADVIEAALGEAAGYMICRNRRTANDVIDYLRREKKGRAGFLILEAAAAMPVPERPEISHDGFIDWADRLLTVDDDISPLARLLLGHIAVVKPGAAGAIMEQLPGHFSAVTTDCELVVNQAAVSGGSSEDFSLLGRKDKIAEQEKLVADLTGRIETFKEDRSRLTSRLGETQAGLQNVREELTVAEEAVEAAERKLTESRYNLQTTDNETARLGDEKTRLMQKQESIRTRQYDLNLNYDNLTKSRSELSNQMQAFNERLEHLEEDAETIEKRFSALQIALVEQRSKKQQLESQLRHTRELIFDIEQNSTAKSDEILAAEQDARNAADRIVILEQELKQAFDDRTAISNNQRQLRDRRGEIQERLDESDKKIKELRQAREQAAGKLHDIEIRLTEIDSETRNISGRIRNEFEVELDEVTAPIPSADIPENERGRHLQGLKDSLKGMGAVNLLALGEFKTSRDRQEFMSAQLNDLLEAKTTLQSTIGKINATARKLFLETFEKVRENFKKVFEELFTGGEADIRLNDPDDPLESSIEIIARPRGKKLLSITQMSGGERALTAISLLFAIYLVKPSPFCILDEIDAPLDDANITRFLRLIKTFSDQTQFIIITHNKLTMEAADVLYGITMETPGVSKVVSVRFSDDDDEIIDTTVGELDYGDSDELPEAIRQRMNPEVTISSSSPEQETE